MFDDIQMNLVSAADLLLTGLLAPLLLVQGRYVRRVTPKLPEPPGQRIGDLGEGKPLRILIVGDSAAAGVGASHQQQALAGKLVAALAHSHLITWRLHANTGDASSDVINRLNQLPEEVFDIVVVSVGVNDATGMTPSAKWLDNLGVLTGIFKNRYEASHIYYSSLPPMHLFPALPNPLRWWLGRRAARLNQLLSDYCNLQSDCTFVPIPYPTDLSFMASDGFHPGPSAYALWADVLHRAIVATDH